MAPSENKGVYTASANWQGGCGPLLCSPPIVQQYCTDLSLDLRERGQVKDLYTSSFPGALIFFIRKKTPLQENLCLIDAFSEAGMWSM